MCEQHESAVKAKNGSVTHVLSVPRHGFARVFVRMETDLRFSAGPSLHICQNLHVCQTQRAEKLEEKRVDLSKKR